MPTKCVYFLDEIDQDDTALAGSKAANLGEMVKMHFSVPSGFVITTSAYRDFSKQNNLSLRIKHLIETIDFNNPNSVRQTAKLIQKQIQTQSLPEELITQIYAAYQKLNKQAKHLLLAVSSSSTTEDLKNASSAGQQESFLNVAGDANLFLKVKAVWQSLFTPRALSYRHEQQINAAQTEIAVVVEQMIEADTAGFISTLDLVTNSKQKVVIEAIYGLGELIVQGTITPDHYEVEKAGLEIKCKTVNQQTVFLAKSSTGNKQYPVAKAKQNLQKITDAQILELTKLALQLEKHYYFPQKIEWAISKNKIYILQTRPITTITKKASSQLSTLNLQLLLKGAPASPGIASGPVKILQSAKEINRISPGDILVTAQINQDFNPALKKAAAIVVEKDDQTAHAVIMARKMGIPAVVGAANATRIFSDGLVICVNGTKGELYQGAINKVSQREDPVEIPTATKIYVKLAQPDIAAQVSKLSTDGVGLLSSESMLRKIGRHPKELIRNHKHQEFIEQLAEQIAVFGKSFYPRPVVFQSSDLKSNEYAALIGGKAYEVKEENPILGLHGAYRYLHDPEVFNLELEAIKIVREEMGLKNLWLMLPFVRTVKELISVKKLISAAGLYRSDSFKLWLRVEIPSNVILLEQFIRAGIDGVSIDADDLTMLMLGIDKDNSEINPLYDQQNPALLWAYEHIIQICSLHKITSSFYGQAVSEYPALVEKLVRWGITGISVSPDMVEQTRSLVAECEQRLIK